MKRYYSFVMVDDVANIDIYGDIIAYPFEEFGEVSAYSLAKQLEQISAREIHVCINSYGGDVAEGVAIYNALKRKAATCKVVTYCDGFACSIASVVFMAGSERVMNEASALMIHNAWTFAQGNAAELRKQADDLDTITQLSITAYMASVNIEEKKLKKLMDGETWILPEEAVEMGFATRIEAAKSDKIAQSAKTRFFEEFCVKMAKKDEKTCEKDEKSEETDDVDDDENDVDDETQADDDGNGAKPDDDSKDDEEDGDEEKSQKQASNASQQSETLANHWSEFFNAIKN